MMSEEVTAATGATPTIPAAAPKVKSKSGTLIKVLFFLVGLAIFVQSRSAFYFVIFGMLPAIMTMFIDRAPHKCASATVFTFNLIGVLPFFKRVFSSSAFESTLQDLIADYGTWINIYSFALLGFVVYLALPALVAKFYIARATVTIESLSERRAKISSEWDIT